MGRLTGTHAAAITGSERLEEGRKGSGWNARAAPGREADVKKRVLIVDDSTLMRMRQERVVKTDNIEVSTATDGHEAVRAAMENPPDLILMDMVMPNLDGLGACRILRSRAETERIPIILMTSQSDPGQIQQGLASGCNDYVTKPLDDGELRAKVERWLQ